ncbi:DUF6624 domain-containing protein [Amycolatopsis sp. NPDC004378]
MAEDTDTAGDLAVLRQELLRRAEVDQAARGQLDPHSPTLRQWQRVSEVDTDNTEFLISVVDQVGWPSKGLVGPAAAHAAWLIAQHAPAECRARWLPLLAAAVDAEDLVAVRDHAYLADRVATDERRPQRWGTQSLCFPGRECRLYPLDDAAGVNARRRSIGLEPLTKANLATAYPSYASIDAAGQGKAPL